jgi:hypothetical protein
VVKLGVVSLDVGPEQPDERGHEVLERIVMHARPPFVEVTQQHLANVAVAKPVSVHNLDRRSLPEPDGFLQCRRRAQVGDTAHQHPRQNDALGCPAEFAQAPGA